MASNLLLSGKGQNDTHLELELILFHYEIFFKTFSFIFFFFENKNYLRKFQKKYLNFLKKNAIYLISPVVFFSKNSKILELFLVSKNLSTLKKFITSLISYFTKTPIFFLLKATKSFVFSEKKDDFELFKKKKNLIIELDKQFPTYLRNSIIRSIDIGIISHFYLTWGLKNILLSENSIIFKKKKNCVFCLYKRSGLAKDSIGIPKVCIKLLCLDFVIKKNFFSCLGVSKIFLQFFIKYVTGTWKLKKTWKMLILKFTQVNDSFFRIFFLDNFFHIFVSKGLNLSFKRYPVIILELSFFVSNTTDLLFRIMSCTQVSNDSINKVVFQIYEINRFNNFCLVKEDSKQFFSRIHCSIKFKKKKKLLPNKHLGKKIRNKLYVSYFGSKCFLKKKSLFFSKKNLVNLKNAEKCREELLFFRAENLEKKLFRINKNYPKNFFFLDMFFCSLFIESSVKKIKTQFFPKIGKKKEFSRYSAFQTTSCLNDLGRMVSKIFRDTTKWCTPNKIFFLFFLILSWDSNWIGKIINFYELVFLREKNFFRNITTVVNHLYSLDSNVVRINQLNDRQYFKKKTLYNIKKKKDLEKKKKKGVSDLFQKDYRTLTLDVSRKSNYLKGYKTFKIFQEKKENVSLFKIKNLLIKKYNFRIFSESENFPIILIRLDPLDFFFNFSKDRILEYLKNLSYDLIRFRKTRLFWFFKIKGFQLKKLKISPRNHWSLLVFNYLKLNLE